MPLKVGAQKHPGTLELGRLLGEGEEDVGGGHLLLAGDPLGRGDELRDPGGPILARRDQEPPPGDRGDGHGDEQAGVIANAGPVQRLRPAPVAGEVAAVVVLGVGGGAGDQRVPPPEGQVAGAPAVLRAGAAGRLERIEKCPGDERTRRRVQEGIPGPLRYVGDSVEDAQAEGGQREKCMSRRRTRK